MADNSYPQLYSCLRWLIVSCMTATDDGATTSANVVQEAAWNGPEGANWAEHSARRVAGGDLIELLLDAAAIEPTTRVLDIGCGIGELTLQAAQRASRGTSLGIDLSAQMIERARHDADAHGVINAEFVLGDAQVHPFAPNSFDLCLSHFGTMFFADPVAAFRNIACAVRPGGRVVFVCPQSMERCDWYSVPLTPLLRRASLDDVAPSAMFSLADATTVRRLLTAAGLHQIDLTPVEHSLWFGDDVVTAAMAFLGSGPVSAILDLDPSLTTGHAQALLESALTPYLTPDGVRLPGNYWLVDSTAAA